MKRPAEMCNLDVKDLEGKILSTEDRIMTTLFYEKGLTKYELRSALGESYRNISKNIVDMENKGYVVRRFYNDDIIFHLTAAGVYELEYRLNTEYFLYLHDFLESYSYNDHDVQAFLRNRFYKLYSEGVWDEVTLLNQFEEWASQRDINIKKLK